MINNNRIDHRAVAVIGNIEVSAVNVGVGVGGIFVEAVFQGGACLDRDRILPCQADVAFGYGCFRAVGYFQPAVAVLRGEILGGDARVEGAGGSEGECSAISRDNERVGHDTPCQVAAKCFGCFGTGHVRHYRQLILVRLHVDRIDRIPFAYLYRVGEVGLPRGGEDAYQITMVAYHGDSPFRCAVGLCHFKRDLARYGKAAEFPCDLETCRSMLRLVVLVGVERMPDTLTGGCGLFVGCAVGHVRGDITCHFDETYLVGRCFPVADRCHVGRHVIHLRHDITLRTGMQDTYSRQQKATFRVVVCHALHIRFVGDVDTGRQAFKGEVERLFLLLVQGDGGRAAHHEGIVVSRPVVTRAERHRGGEGTDCHAIEQSLPGNDLAVIVIFRQVGYGDDVGIVARTRCQVDSGRITTRRIARGGRLQLYLVREVGVCFARFGRFVHLHAFRFGMHEESHPVDTFLVVGSVVQRVANRTGFQAGADGSRQARYALGERCVASPADLLDVAAIKGGQRQE